MSKKIKILFLCTGNSCRSQMAEGLARHLKGTEIEPFSAGTEPQTIDPLAVEAMNEIGIDISGQRAKHVDEIIDTAFDIVVTLCGNARETCPVFPGPARIIHRGFEDPPALGTAAKTREEAMAHYREVRDEIKKFINTLPGSLNADQDFIIR
ncbi:MAG: arsenate reductase ArsC [Spirochaetes bacterium]|jgi:arsenate reductase|nr:arsenate reductase ArsC [Spirochaetota bacterium]